MVVAKVHDFRHFSQVPISFVKVPDMVTFFRRKPGYEHRSGEPLGKPGGMLPPEYVLFEVKLSEMLFSVFLRLEKQYRPLRSYIIYHLNMWKKKGCFLILK